MGRITKWNDKRIAALNPGVKLPDSDIIVVHRSDGSGTTYIFTDYLNKFSREWKDKVGFATSVNWPVGLGGKGNEGVTQQVKQTEGAHRLRRADLRPFEQAGVRRRSRTRRASSSTPSLESVTAAAASAPSSPRTPISGCRSPTRPGADAYPIASFTWLLVPEGCQGPGQGQAI